MAGKRLARRRYMVMNTGSYSVSIRSPSLIHPIRRKNNPKAQHKTAGRTKEIKISPSQSVIPGAMAAAPLATALSLGDNHPVHTPICPTSPQVPMPEDTGGPFISISNKQVAMGPARYQYSGQPADILCVIPASNIF